MDSSPFATIPAELRNEIYSYLFELPSPITLVLSTENKCFELSRTSATMKNFTTLAKTCRQLHQEITPIVMGQNKFILEANLQFCFEDQLKTSIKNWLKCCPRKLLKDVSLHLTSCEHIDRGGVVRIITKCKQLSKDLPSPLKVEVLYKCEDFRMRSPGTWFRFSYHQESGSKAMAEIEAAVETYRRSTAWPEGRAKRHYITECMTYMKQIGWGLDQESDWSWNQ